ncbi:unnamed protein product [Rhodiola kirilowii]
MAFIATPSPQTSRFAHTQLLHYHLPTASFIPQVRAYGFASKVIRRRMRKSIAPCFVLEESDRQSTSSSSSSSDADDLRLAETEQQHRISARARKKLERFTYMIAAVLSSFGITSMAVYSRFSWQMELGMELWSRWAHKALWHGSLWRMHESHHKPRVGQFELNDVFAIINSIAAIALLSYGFFHNGLVPGLCFGVGLGVTMCGMAYMFVHDGLVHRRFPVGPIANVPYLRKVAAAHQLHHSKKFNGVPYGFFLGPRELEEVGGSGELQKEIDRRIKL